MDYHSEKQPRKRLRLTGYSYTDPGYYFVTICVQNRECLFGNVVGGRMHLNSAGNMVRQSLISIGKIYKGWLVDTQVVMPNHIHAIFYLDDLSLTTARISLSDVIRNVKSYTTVCYLNGILESKWESFDQSLWQRSYYEHIIRDNESLDRIRQYILDNPANWQKDQNYRS
jgi:putative transposase